MAQQQRLKERPRQARKRYEAGAADLRPGERRIVEVGGKSVGIFNVAGAYFALHNRCPHMAGALCGGAITGTTLPTEAYEFVYGREGEILRCGWHGWEFEIDTGICLVDRKIRARTYEVTVESGNLILHI